MATRITLGDQSWLFDEDDLTNAEVILIEEQLDLTLDEVFGLMRRGSVKAFTAIVWILRRRDEPDLAFKDVTFKVSQLDFDDSEEVGKDSQDGTGHSTGTT